MAAIEAAAMPEAGCVRACAPCRGASCERYGRIAFDDAVQETVDAVSGATWGTRNRIMEGLFQQDMADHGDAMPTYRPPGT